MQNSVLTRIVVVLLGLLLVPSSVAAIPSDLNYSLESYYSYETNYDDQTGFKDGTGVGTTLVPGIIGNGVSQPTSAEVTVAARPMITEGSTQTWVQMSSTYQAGESLVRWQQANVGGGNNGDFGLQWGQGSSGGLYWNNENAGGNFESTLQTWTAGQWYHIVLTWNSTASERKIYVNGALDNTNTDSFPGVWSSGATQHNELMDINSWAHTVLWDEQGIWNGKVLTAAEVILLYNSGAGCSYTAINDGSCAAGGGGGGNVTNGTSNIIGAPPGFFYNLTYDASTKIVNYNWSDQYNTMNNARLDIRYFGGGQYILNTSQQNSSNPGVITANISNLVDQNFTVRALAYLTDNNRTFLSGNTTLINQLWIYPTPVINASTFTIDEPEGVFWGAMIVGTMIIMSAVNPPVAIIAGVTGLFFTSLFGFIALQLETLFLVALLAGILIWRMRR